MDATEQRKLYGHRLPEARDKVKNKPTEKPKQAKISISWICVL